MSVIRIRSEAQRQMLQRAASDPAFAAERKISQADAVAALAHHAKHGPHSLPHRKHRDHRPPPVIVVTGGGGSSPAPVPPAPGIKAGLRGLGSMGNTGSNGGFLHAWVPDNSLTNIASVNIQSPTNVISWVVLNYTWAQIQPTSGSDFVTTAIDSDIAAIRAYNLANPATPLRASLRIWQGINTPAWAMPIGGGPLHVADRNNHPVTVPAYWDPGFQAALANLVTLLGNQYDQEPLVARFSSPFSASVDDEPFVEAQDAPGIPSIAILDAGGLGPRTDAAKQLSLQYACNPAIWAAWPTTPIELTTNVTSLMDTGTVINNDAITTAIMVSWRAAIGDRGTLGHHGLISPPSVNPHLDAIYQEFLTLGPTINFQTEQVGMTLASIQRGIQFGARAIELWDGINGHTFANIAVADLIAWAALLAA